MTGKFRRSETVRLLRLGKNRRKLQKWRKPRGRHSKIRRKRMGYPVQPGVGFKKPMKEKQNNKIVLIGNIQDLKNVNKESKTIISRRVGAKKRIEILKEMQNRGFKINNRSKEEER